MKIDTVDTSNMNEAAAALALASALQPAPKPITAAKLKAAADAHITIGRQIAELAARIPAIARDYDALCATCDLDDKSALNELARLQMLSGVLPKRIEARENEFLASARALGKLNGNFIGYTLGPRVRALRSKAGEEVRKVFSQIVSDEFLLNRAVEESDPLEAINSLYCTFNSPADPAQTAAEVYRILGSFELLQEYEKISATAIKRPGKISYSEWFSKQMGKQSATLQSIRETWQKTAEESKQNTVNQPA